MASRVGVRVLAEMPETMFFWLMERSLDAILKPGRQCSKAMHKMDKALRTVQPADVFIDARTMNGIGIGMLQSRCAICRDRCKRPLA